MSAILLEALVIGLLLITNGVLSMSEMAVVTARRSRLKRSADSGDRRARAALELAAEPTPFLSTVQVGITLIGTLAGAFGGATIAGQLEIPLAAVPGIGTYAEGIALPIVVVAIAFASLIVGELVPKRIALARPEAVARVVAPSMKVIARAARPLVWVLSTATEFVLKLLPVRGAERQSVTEEDIRALVAEGRAAGAVHQVEEEILGRVLALGDQPVGQIMVPRMDLDWLGADEGATAAELVRRSPSPAWLLVCGRSVDEVVGVVSARDVLLKLAAQEPIDLRQLAQPPVFLPETVSVLRVMKALKEGPVPVALALDEYGGVNGLVTFDRVVEHVLTEMPGRSHADPDIVARESGGWLVDGATPIARLAEELALPVDDPDQWQGYRTAAGMVLATLGRLPRVGEHAVISGYRFEVVDLDGRRIDRLLVTRID